MSRRNAKRNQEKTPYRKKKVNRDENQDSKQLDNKDRDNDPNWYFLSSEIADQASTFSFNQYIGTDTPVNVNILQDGLATTKEAKFRVPSIVAMECNPSPGDTENGSTGINIAALRIYTTLSARNAKTSIYAPQDVSTLILAFGEIVSLLEHIRRAFGIAYTYNQRNRALPKRLLQMMGFDPEEFLSGLADHRMEFNSWITALNKVPFPTNIAYIYKCMDMYRGVYLDSESSMAQVVFTRPYYTWVLDETLDEQGSVLVSKTTPIYNSNVSLQNSWSQWSELINSQINALLTSATFNAIFSDILMLHDKYSMPLTVLDYLASDYIVMPEYNRNYMLQVHNAVPIGRPIQTANTFDDNTADNNVYHNINENRLSYRPLFKIDNGTYLIDTIIDMDTPEASVVDRIEATRYSACGVMVSDTVGKKSYMKYDLPDHYVVDFRVLSGEGELGDEATDNNKIDSCLYNFLSKAVDITTLPNVYNLSQIDWAPMVYFVRNGADGVPYVTMIGDLNYWTTLDAVWFQRVNDLTFQALFAIR